MAHKDTQEIKQPKLGVIGWLRYAWTQLTSMSTAIFLLLLLAVGAVPGSIFPQRSVDASKVTQYKTDHPDTFPILDKFQLFDVYSSVWFSAIYLLLFISLIGCVIPRARAHWRHWRSAPPRTPANFRRLPESGTVEAAGSWSASDAMDRAAALLKKRGYRVDLRPGEGGRPASIGAERGMIKELGNLLFHISLIGVLVAVAIGGMYGYRGQRIIVEGETFVNTLVSYDTFSPGSKFTADKLSPYTVTLNKFNVQFDRDSTAHYGQPLAFDAQVTTNNGKGTVSNQSLKVNSPLELGNDRVYLVGNGYAPIVTVKDGKGNVSFQGPVVAVPQDGMYTSLFVLKVPDASPQQLAFSGFLLPTTARNSENVSFSADPDPFAPTLTINSYEGDLGLNTGKPQNVYVLDTSSLKELNNRKLGNGIVLKPNQTVTLPNGRGSITFTDLKRYIAVDVHHDPGQGLALVSATLALVSLIASLFIARRRLWLTFSEGDNGTLNISYGLLARGEDPRLGHEATAVRDLLTKHFTAETEAPA
jgi:cytochrome c biogenesis protein